MRELPKPDVPATGLGAARAASSGAASTDPRSLSRAAECQESGRGYGIAYAFLNRRERTVEEVRARLQKAEIDAREIEEVIEELLQFGYLDDARYARVFAEDKRNLEQWGNDRITRSLRERGVDRDVITAALAALPEHDELSQAVDLLNRRFPGGPATFKDRDRAFGVLIRKGYDSELAADAIRAWASHR